MRAVLGLTLGWANACGWLSKNPRVRVRLPKQTGGRRVTRTVLTAEKVTNIADGLHEPYATVVLLLAETGLRISEALAICQKRVQKERPAGAGPFPRESPDNKENGHLGWVRFQTMSLLGACLLGQREHAEAEPLLIGGYEGLKSREAEMLPQNAKNVPQAAARLVQLYEAWGKPEKAAEWRTKLPPTAGAGRPKP